MKILILVAILSSVIVGTESLSFQVCGNYCGPGWCNGEFLDESECDTSYRVESFTGLGLIKSCPDSCCKIHDRCCGGSDRRNCNREIIECLESCASVSFTCTKSNSLLKTIRNGKYDVTDGPMAFLPIGVQSTPIILGAMNLVKDWCCGSPCSSDGSSFLEAVTKKKRGIRKRREKRKKIKTEKEKEGTAAIKSFEEEQKSIIKKRHVIVEEEKKSLDRITKKMKEINLKYAGDTK